MFITKDAPVAAHGAARPRRGAGAAAARQHGAGADRARPRPRPRRSAARRVLRAERHVDALLVPEDRRAARRAAADAAVAGGVQGSACCCCGGLADEPANLRQGRRRPRALGRHLPDRRAVQDHRRRRRLSAGRRWTRSPRRSSPRRPSSPRSSSASSRTRCSASCDGGASCALHQHHRLEHPTTPLPIENDPRAVFERLFGTSGSTDRGGAAGAHRSRTGASSTSSTSEIARPANSCIGPQRPGRRSTSTSTRCATSSGASRWPRSRTPASCRSSISRSASRPTTPSTPG